jgi:hypothetical protein
MKTLPFFVIFAITGLSQPVERVLPFKQLQTPVEMNEAATVIRSIGEIPHLSVEPIEKAITVKSSLAQAELAEWLMVRLDRSGASSNPVPSQLEYRPVSGTDAVVRVFYFKNTLGLQERNEMATTIRSLIEIPFLYTSQAAGAMVVRGSRGHADAAQWAFESLDAKGAGGTDHYRLPGGGDDTLRLFTMPNKGTVGEFYKLANQVRTELRAVRFYAYSPRRIIAIRGTEELMGRAAQVLAKP